MKAKYLLLVVVASVLTHLSVVASAQLRHAARETAPSKSAVATLIGRVTQNKFTSITVSAVGKPIIVNVTINPQTKLSLDGIATSAAKIGVGDSVVVTYLPRSDAAVNAIAVEAHHHRVGKLEAQLDPTPTPVTAQTYPYCPNVGSGGTIPGTKTPCYCNKCGGAGSGMVW